MRTFFLLLTAITAMGAAAHPGHDHYAVTSEPIHLLTLLAMVALVITVDVIGQRRLHRRHTQANTALED